MTKYITYIQLRATRHVLNLGVREIAKILKVSKATISNTELGKTRDFLYKHSAALIDYFALHNISFPNEYSIRYNNSSLIVRSESHILTRFQLKAARHILNINQLELAKSINVDRNVISRAEQLDNELSITFHDQTNLQKLKVWFQEHNIEFPDQLSIFFKKYMDN
jgi:transcriptional regulator with XRE-family HTH domain